MDYFQKKLKNSLIGLGILSLLFSFYLLLSGTLGDKESQRESFVSQAEEIQQESQLNACEIDLQEGILFGRTENRDFYQLVRKFPAASSCLILLLNNGIEVNCEPFGDGLSFYPVKDFPVTYKNLRI